MKTGICALESPNLPSRDDTPLLVCVQGCTPVPGPYDPLRSLGIPWAQTADHSSCFGQCQQHESIRELQVIPSFLMNVPIWCLCQCLKSLEFQSASPQPSPRQRKLSTKAAVQQVPGRLRRAEGPKVPKRRCFRQGLGLPRTHPGLCRPYASHSVERYKLSGPWNHPIHPRTKVKAFVGQREMPLCCSTLPGFTNLGNEASYRKILQFLTKTFGATREKFLKDSRGLANRATDSPTSSLELPRRCWKAGWQSVLVGAGILDSTFGIVSHCGRTLAPSYRLYIFGFCTLGQSKGI